MSFNVGVLKVLNSGKESEWEWKVENFSLSQHSYVSPIFKFEGVSWHLELFLNRTDGYIHPCLRRSSHGSPINVEYSLAIETTEGMKSFERCNRYCFEGCDSVYYILEWIQISDFRNRQREFLSSGCLTLFLTLKMAESGESETTTIATECSGCKENLHGDKIAFHRKCLDVPAKCPRCYELVCLQKWFDHKCKDINMKAASSAVACSSYKRNLQGDRNSLHKDRLNKAAKRQRCDDIVNLQNWRHHNNQMTNIKAATSTTESSMTCGHHEILQDLKQLFLNQEQTDVVLRVKGKEFPTHKAILAARSPVFASTFRNKKKEKKIGVVEIEDCDPSVFPDFLRFLYCNDMGNFSRENMFGLFTIADKYQCKDLKVKCVRFIKDNLTVESFCKALEVALLHNETELLCVATDFFIKNAEKILVTPGWQTFVAEYPTYSNKLFIKYVNSTTR